MNAPVTIPNIGRKGQQRRLLSGAAMIVGAASLLSVLIVSGAPRAVRLLVFLPALAGALGVLQSREKT